MPECERSSFESSGPAAQPASDAEDARRVIERCHVLLSESGEVSGERLANEALAAYQALSGGSLTTFFSLLASRFSPDPDLVDRWADAYRQHPSRETLAELQRAVEPPRQELFRRLNLASTGTATLIEMRRRILRGVDEHPPWGVVASDLAHLLRSWFNGGFLEFRRIDWRTPPAVLENVIKYEAVHQIRDWQELRRRLQEDRRCFGFFHPSLPEEPLVFIELALTSRLSAKVQPLLDPDSPVVDPASCRYAMFYSISSCHEGLRGVTLGNALIRRAVDSLSQEFPRLKTFATLSPVPGFRAWLTGAATGWRSTRRRHRRQAGRVELAARGHGIVRAATSTGSAVRLVPSVRQARTGTCRSRRTLSPGQRGAPRAPQLDGRYVRGRHQSVGGSDGELPVQVVGHRAESPGVRHSTEGDRLPPRRKARSRPHYSL